MLAAAEGAEAAPARLEVVAHLVYLLWPHLVDVAHMNPGTIAAEATAALRVVAAHLLFYRCFVVIAVAAAAAATHGQRINFVPPRALVCQHTPPLVEIVADFLRHVFPAVLEARVVFAVLESAIRPVFAFPGVSPLEAFRSQARRRGYWLPLAVHEFAVGAPAAFTGIAEGTADLNVVVSHCSRARELLAELQQLAIHGVSV